MQLSNRMSQNLSLQLSTALELDKGVEEIYNRMKNNEKQLKEKKFIDDMQEFFLQANKKCNFSPQISDQDLLDSDKDKLRRTLFMAAERHHEEFRESGFPYLAHVYSAGFVLARLGVPKEVVMAGILHDSIEDTNNKKEYMNLLYEHDPQIAAIVFVLSGPDIKDAVEKDKILYSKIDKFSADEQTPYIKAVKCADGIANLHDIEFMKAKDGRTALERQMKFIDNMRSKIIPYAKNVDDKDIIKVANKEEKFSIEEYISDLIKEKIDIIIDQP